MLPVADKSSGYSTSYAVFTFAADDAAVITIPIGVAMWSQHDHWFDFRLVGQDERLKRFRTQEHYPYVALIQEKLHQWMRTKRLPYADAPYEPHETAWWSHARQLFVHRIRLSEPRPIDCRNPQQELEPLYEAVVSPYRNPREQHTRVDGQISKCLDDLLPKFKLKQELAGYKGRKITVQRAFCGPRGTVVIEGVNLAVQAAEREADAAVSKLLRLKRGIEGRLDLLVGYLASPEGLNGEGVLRDWIEEQTGAKTFDLVKNRRELYQSAGNLLAQASIPSGPK